MKKVSIKVDGKVYKCEATFDCLMEIETKIKIRSLALDLVKSQNNAAAFPYVHLIFIASVLLNGAGCYVTPEELLEQFKQSKMDQELLANVALYVLEEVYGVGPQKKSQETESQEQTESPT